MLKPANMKRANAGQAVWTTVGTIGRWARWRAVAALALMAVALACRQPPRGHARVLQTQPAAGDATPDQLRDGVRLVFDRAVAPPAQVGKPLARTAFRIEPPIAGRWGTSPATSCSHRPPTP